MAYQLPSLLDLSQGIRRLFTAAVPGAVVSVWPNTWTVLGKVMAPLAYQFHLRLAWLYRQMFASTADALHLARHGYELGMATKPAARASGIATLPSQSGLSIPAGVRFARGDGAIYATSAAGHATTGTLALPLIAETPGAAGNSSAGDIFAPVSSDELVGYWLASGLVLPTPTNFVATVDGAGIGGGADGEDVEAFRARVLFRKQNPPGGGSVADWTRWAESVPIVTDVVVDTFVNDVRRVWICVLAATRPNRVPTGGDIAAVQSALDTAYTRPVTAVPVAVAPTPVSVAVSIANLSPNTAAVQAAITTELQALFATRPEPATPNRPFVFRVALIDEAIGSAPGYQSHTRVLPASDLTFATAGQLPVLGAVTFV